MMTLEEAIAVLEESKRQNKIMRDNPTTFWASYQIADGIKNTKRRIDALDAALSALRTVSREQVEKVWRGNWKKDSSVQVLVSGGQKYHFRCSKCGYITRLHDLNFCSKCGAPMTDEAVQMVMERMEKLYEQTSN